MNDTTKFKVTMEFRVEINPISVPDADAFQKLGPPPGSKAAKKPPSEKELRAGLKAKGLSEADIEKYMAGAKKGGKDANVRGKGQGQDYQMLIYPEYETWAAAQRALQAQILKDPKLCEKYVQEMVRDLTRGRMDALLDDKHGRPNLNGVLKEAMQRLPDADQVILKAEFESLLHDETELVDNSVDCQFAGVTVSRL